MRSIEEKDRDILNLAKELIGSKSENPPGNEESTADIVLRRLDQLGIRNVRVLSRTKDRPNIIATVDGRRAGKELILNGHIDTMPAGDLSSWKYNPFSGEIVNQELYGRGSADMKGAIAAFIETAGALAKKPDFDGKLTLIFNPDEEAGGSHGMGWLVQNKKITGDAAIIGEPSGISSSFEFLDIAERGLYWFDLIFTGDQMHSSMIKLVSGVSASREMIKTLNQMLTELDFGNSEHSLYPQGVTVNFGAIVRGGLGYSTIPGEVTVGSDARFPPGVTANELERKINSFLDNTRKSDSDLRIEMKPKMYVEAAETLRTDPIVSACEQGYSTIFGFKPKLGGFPAATDGRFLINQLHIPTVTAFGPGLLTLAHAPNERVSIDHLVKAAKIYALASLNFLEPERRHDQSN